MLFQFFPNLTPIRPPGEVKWVIIQPLQSDQSCGSESSKNKGTIRDYAPTKKDKHNSDNVHIHHATEYARTCNDSQFSSLARGALNMQQHTTINSGLLVLPSLPAITSQPTQLTQKECTHDSMHAQESHISEHNTIIVTTSFSPVQ